MTDKIKVITQPGTRVTLKTSSQPDVQTVKVVGATDHGVGITHIYQLYDVDAANAANGFTLVYDGNTHTYIVKEFSANSWANVVGFAGNSWANFVGFSANSYAASLTPDLTPPFNQANLAFDKANTANTLAYDVSIGANAYAEFVGQSANSYAVSLTPDLTPAFTQANTAFDKANTANTLAYQVSIGSNTWANFVGSSANSYAASLTPDLAPAFNQANAAYSKANTANTLAYDVGVAANSYAAATYYSKYGGTIGGDVAITGDLTISGNTTYANTQTLLIGDNILTLNADLPRNVSPTENAGIEVDRGNATNTALIWNEVIDKWTFTNDGNTFVQIASNTEILAGNAYATLVGQSANSYASSLTPDLTPAFNRANAAYARANAVVSIANSAPSTPNIDDLWWNTDLGSMFIYYNDGDTTQWVELSVPIGSVESRSNTSTGFNREYLNGSSTGLNPELSDSIDIVGYKAYVLLSITTNVSAWVRVYASADARTADLNRSIGVDPVAGAGLIAEVVTTGNTEQILSPYVVGGNMESPVSSTIYIRVTNKSDTTTAINTRLNVIKIEA